MRTFRHSVGLTLLAGATAFVLIPAAHARRSGGDPRASATVQGRAAVQQTQQLLRHESLAVRRNTHDLQQRQRFNQMLLRLHSETPQDPRQAQRIRRAIRDDRLELAQVDRNILASRRHLLTVLPGATRRVQTLLDTLARLAPNHPRVAAFYVFALRREQTVLAQLIQILNQEHASIILPGQG